MSLDFDLEGDTRTEHCLCPNCENEHTRQVADNIYSANITHNLTEMASEAGIYKALWHPNENGMFKAKDIIPALTTGLEKLKANPKHFEKFNSPNGWGTYRHFVPFVEGILNACIENPDANIRTWT